MEDCLLYMRNACLLYMHYADFVFLFKRKRKVLKFVWQMTIDKVRVYGALFSPCAAYYTP